MLDYPLTCATPAKRTEYAYRAQELLRRVHNIFGKWYREGIDKSLWKQLPKDFQTLYPYKTGLLKEQDWLEFLAHAFEPRERKITAAILEQRELFKESLQWDIDVGKI